MGRRGATVLLAFAIAALALLASSWRGSIASVDGAAADDARVMQPNEMTPWVYLPLLSAGRRGIGPTPGTVPPTVPATSATSTSTGQLTATITRTPEPTAVRTRTPAPTSGPHDPATDRLVPGAALADGGTRVTFDADLQQYRLAYRGEPSVVYEVDLKHPDVARGRLTVREATSGRYPMAGAGLYYRTLEGDLVEPRLMGRIGTVDAVLHAQIEDGVELTVHETIEDRAHTKRYRLVIQGRALSVHAQSLDKPVSAAGAYAGFTAGDFEGTNDGVDVRVPYMESVPVTMLDHMWFASTLLDMPQSHATSLMTRGPKAQPGAFVNEVAALYFPDEAARVAPVDETVWAVVSPRIEDTFPVAIGRESPYREQLSGEVHVTLSSQTDEVSFGAEAAFLDRLRDLGVSDLMVHKLNWREPTELLPAQGPPASAAGGADGLAVLSASAAGGLVPSMAYSVTVEGCPGEPAPFYRTEDRVSDADGKPKRLLPDAGGERDCGGGETAGTYLLAPDAARRIALDEGEAFAVAGSGALHLSDITAWNPAYAWPLAESSVIDRASPAPHPRNVGEAVLAFKQLFGGVQSAVGPVFGDGAHGSWHAAYDSFYAGYVDGVSRSLSTGSTGISAGDAYLVVPDYEVTVVRPRMANYGIGPYEQFFGLSPSDPVVPLTEQQIDAWRATSLSYGHAGAFTSTVTDQDWLTEAETVKEYYLMRALQARYMGAPAAVVSYVADDGTEGDLSWALTEGLDLIGPRLHITYADELELWVNLGRADWTVTPDEPSLGLVVLPPLGWLADGPGGLLGYSALQDGARVDYLRSPDYQVADGRGELVSVQGIVTTDLTIVLADGRVLEEQTDGTMRWAP